MRRGAAARREQEVAELLRIRAFEGYRPGPGLAERVAALPYDVVDRDEAAALAEGNEHSFLHVTRPEIDLPPDTDPYSDAVYARAADAWRKMTASEAMVREEKPRLYLYRQEAELLGRKRAQVGLVCCCHIDDYNSGVIKKHEKTRQAKEDDRTRHVLETNINAGPVFLMHRDDDEISALIEREIAAGEPAEDFRAPDGVRHTLWVVREATPFVDAMARLPAAYVADGHHRSASAARAGAERRAANPHHTGDEAYNWFLSVVFPAGALTILPYHRVVRDLNGLSPVRFLDALRELGELRKLDASADHTPDRPGSVCVHVDGGWWGLTFPESSIDRTDPVASLDYQLLSDRVLGPVLGIEDIRTDERIDFVGGIRGPGALRERVESGRSAAGFSMHPVTIEQLVGVADAGAIMPPKSTWFEPKLRSGLVVHSLD